MMVGVCEIGHKERSTHTKQRGTQNENVLGSTIHFHPWNTHRDKDTEVHIVGPATGIIIVEVEARMSTSLFCETGTYSRKGMGTPAS